MVGYSKRATRDLASTNITVNVVQAGVMDTDVAAPLKEGASALFATFAIAPYACLEKVAFDIIFLTCTGTVLDVEGGYSA